MASCLGISVGKNLIKYAKLSKEKGQTSLSIDGYGVKFYDILSQTIAEIIAETKSDDASISVCITSEDYEKTECFKQMKAKDRETFLNSEFEEICQKKSLSPGVLDTRFVLAEDVMNPDQYKVICVAAGKVELNNLWQALSKYKFDSISAVGTSITNLLKEKGAGENCLIVNIEDDTKLTYVKNGEINELIQIPVGMDEVISRLADKYNSYARAYEACKGVDAYADSTTEYSLDDDAQSIRDVLMPMLYDLKQRIIMEVEPFIGEVQQVYITGTGIIVNNIDLYLQEAFKGCKTEILVPYFVNKERSSLKDVLEVNSALAASSYCLDGINKDLDFLASGNYLKKEARSKKFEPKAIFGAIKEKVDDLNQKTLKTRKTGKKKKKTIEFDNEVENLGQLGGAGEYSAPQFEEDVEYYDPMAEWFIRIALALFVGWIAYTAGAWLVESNLDSKILAVSNNIVKTENEIKRVNSDSDAIYRKASEYKEKTARLQTLINTIRLKKERNYEVPNFLSQLMFIIPSNVKVSSIQIPYNGGKRVTLEASSGMYAQLGYFVSRLKLSGILKNVEMEVVDMSSSIVIKVSGVLP
jgi:hypothetical protein